MDRATLNGHVERVEECRDWIEQEHIYEGGDTSGRLREYVESISVVLGEVEKIKKPRARRRQRLTDADRSALDDLCNLLSSMPMDTGEALRVISKLRGR